MTREELIKKVALKMDEISSSDDVIIPVGTGDNNPLYTQINSLLNESINEVLLKSPIYRITDQVTSLGTPSNGNIFSNARKTVKFTVDEDFIRLAYISFGEGNRIITDLAIEGDDVSKRQSNKFLVAKEEKPVAVLERTTDGRQIVCYSFATVPTTKNGYYVKRYDSTVSDETGLSDYVIDVVSWVCAGKVFSAQGDVTRSKICDENAVALMV